MTTSKRRQSPYDPSSEDFRKEEFPFYWLARTFGRYQALLNQRLKKLDIDVPRWRILFILKEEGISSMSTIAEHAIAKLPTITKIVYRMKEDGLVDTRTSDDDGRVTEVLLTPKGHQMISAIEESTRTLFQRSFKGMTGAQIQRLNRLLETLDTNLSD